MDWITIIFEIAIKVFEKWWTPSLHGQKQKVFGHRRSIVRLIGTMLPLAQANRVHLGLAVWRYDNEYELVSNGANSVSSISDFMDEGHGSLSTETGALPAANSDMKKLLEEILDLKTKMNEIIQRQNVNTCCGQSSCCSLGSTYQQPASRSVLPPPPPPPPPPMPVILTERSTPRNIGKQMPQNNGKIQKPAGLSAVLNELKSSKVTLKRVLRSPGGRPLRESGSESAGTPTNDYGGDMLAEILRRRLSQTQYSDSDCSISSVHSDFFASPDRHFP